METIRSSRPLRGPTGAIAVGALALLASTTVPPRAAADVACLPLDAMLGAATVRAIGQVIGVAEQGDLRVATIAVDEHLGGTGGPPSLTVAWDVRDPEAVTLPPGTRLFGALAGSGGGPASHRTAVPACALVPLVPDTEPVVRTIVQAALAAGGSIPVATAMSVLTGPGPTPPTALLRPLLDDVGRRTGPSDGAAVGQLACAPRGSIPETVRRWAVEQVGRTRSDTGLACARAIVGGALATKSNPRGGDVPGASAALRALGDDAQPLSVNAIKRLVKLAQKPPPNAGERSSGELSPLLLDGILAFARTGHGSAAAALYKAATKQVARPIAGTAVHGLGILGDARAARYLARIADRHPDDRIRQQAVETLARIGG